MFCILFKVKNEKGIKNLKSNYLSYFGTPSYDYVFTVNNRNSSGGKMCQAFTNNIIITWEVPLSIC